MDRAIAKPGGPTGNTGSQGRQPWEQQVGGPKGTNLNNAGSQSFSDSGKVVIAQLGTGYGVNPLNSRIPTSTIGNITATSVALPGVRGPSIDPSTGRYSQGSQITFSSEGTTVFVTTNTENIWAIPFYEGGSLGTPYPLAVGGPTYEIYLREHLNSKWSWPLKRMARLPF